MFSLLHILTRTMEALNDANISDGGLARMTTMYMFYRPALGIVIHECVSYSVSQLPRGDSDCGSAMLNDSSDGRKGNQTPPRTVDYKST
jgi:hypothetical protein